MKRVLINPKETQPMYDAFHLSQANRIGDMIWVSGQVGVGDKLTPASGMAAQARLAFEGLKRTLAAAGATLEDVVDLTTFHLDLRGEMEQFAKVKDQYLPRDYPAWTAVGVTQLALSGLADRNPRPGGRGIVKRLIAAKDAKYSVRRNEDDSISTIDGFVRRSR